MSTIADDTIVAEITIKASAERLFEALTDPEQRMKWWGLKGRFETTEMESDLRVGGRWAMRGTGMGGTPFSVTGEYRSIERPRLLAFTWLPSWDPRHRRGNAHRRPADRPHGRGARRARR